MPSTLPLCRVVGTGHSLPNSPISNAELIAKHGLESTPEWIESRTGITQRYFVQNGQSTSTLATAAAQEALQNADVAPDAIDAILVATCTPDYTFPSVAALTQAALGMRPGTVALDVNAACSGFIAALGMAQGMFATQQRVKRILVIGAETFSNVLDFKDRSTCVLFGDGAGAVLLERTDGQDKRGLLHVAQGADGQQAQLLHSGNGVARGHTAGVVHMDGAAVYKNAVRQMGDSVQATTFLQQSQHTLEDVDWLVPHQANARIIQAAGTALGIDADKVILTVGLHANTSAASIPLALHYADSMGQLQPGQLILLQAFGAGFTWGMVSLVW